MRHPPDAQRRSCLVLAHRLVQRHRPGRGLRWLWHQDPNAEPFPASSRKGDMPRSFLVPLGARMPENVPPYAVHGISGHPLTDHLPAEIPSERCRDTSGDTNRPLRSPAEPGVTASPQRPLSHTSKHSGAFNKFPANGIAQYGRAKFVLRLQGARSGDHGFCAARTSARAPDRSWDATASSRRRVSAATPGASVTA